MNPFDQILREQSVKTLIHPATLSKRSPEDFLKRMKIVIKSLAVKMNIPLDNVRISSHAQMIVLIHAVISGGVLVMRHGEQMIPPEYEHLDSAARKIKMMQMPHNQQDGITKASALEFLQTILILVYIKQHTDVTFRIKSSVNQRASQPAEALSTLLGLASVSYQEKWSCVNYPADHIMEDLGLVDELNEGTLPWKKGSVDLVVGQGTFDKITSSMDEFYTEGFKPDTLTVILTHSQQTQALCQRVGLTTDRLQPFGFLCLNSEGCTLFKHGIYEPDKTLYDKRHNLCQSQLPSNQMI